MDGVRPGLPVGTSVVTCRIDRLDLADGSYSLDVSVARPDGSLYHQDRRTVFTMTSPQRDVGIVRLPRTWSVSSGVRSSTGGSLST